MRVDGARKDRPVAHTETPDLSDGDFIGNQTIIHDRFDDRSAAGCKVPVASGLGSPKWSYSYSA